ncbi:MAG: hypothetical protein ACLT3Y_05420 [Ruminococcus callidus]
MLLLLIGIGLMFFGQSGSAGGDGNRTAGTHGNAADFGAVSSVAWLWQYAVMFGMMQPVAVWWQGC